MSARQTGSGRDDTDAGALGRQAVDRAPRAKQPGVESPADLAESPTVKQVNDADRVPAAAARGALPAQPGPGMLLDAKDQPLMPANPDAAAVLTERVADAHPGKPTGVPQPAPLGLTGQRERGDQPDQMVWEAPTLPPNAEPDADLPSAPDQEPGAPAVAPRGGRGG